MASHESGSSLSDFYIFLTGLYIYLKQILIKNNKYMREVINMKKLVYIFFILFLCIFSSCKNTEIPIKKDNNPPAATERMESNENNPGTIQSIPQQDTEKNITPSKSHKPSATAKKTNTKEIQAKKTQTKKTQNKKVKKKIRKSPPKVKPLAQYSTPILNQHKDRINNMKLASRKINNFKIQSGDVFSFNDVVGERNEKNGFKLAAIIINGEYDKDLGGGVCQLSSTLYNAADKSGLSIIERHAHSKPITYLPKGRDAAVSYGYLDLKFKNTKSYPVKIKAWVKNNRVYAAIYKAK